MFTEAARKARLLRSQIGLKLYPLRFEDSFAAALGFGSGVSLLCKHGVGLIDISVPAGKLARQISFRGDRGLEALLSSRMSLIKTVPGVYVQSEHESTRPVQLPCQASAAAILRLCLIDTGHRLSDARVLQLPLAKISSMPARAGRNRGNFA